MKISYIIPITPDIETKSIEGRDCLRFLNETFMSIENQTITHWEIILVANEKIFHQFSSKLKTKIYKKKFGGKFFRPPF
jgi:hypothetical protein